ncbi:MAG: hypothetical protein Q8Q06_02370 [bacterium]|nr:hypothetical protein [bacterium]
MNKYIAVCLLAGVLVLGGISLAYGESSPTLTTDKDDYLIGETATISGLSFNPSENFNIKVYGGSDADGTYTETNDVVASDENGKFIYSYTLDLVYRPLYVVAVSDLNGVELARTTFTDAPPAVSLEQCRNGAVGTPNNCEDLGGGSGWVSGNVGASQGHYLEGHSIPYRAVLTNLPVNTPITLTLGYDIKHSGAHAIDYLTHFDRLDPHTQFSHSAESVNPTDGVSGFSATTTTFTVLAPDTINSPVFGQPATSFNALLAGERVMTLFGGTISGISYDTDGDLTAAQSETRITVTFSVDDSTAVLAWGGHIATQEDWGVGQSAGGISGSPYHMRLIDWNLNNLGNTDRSLSAAVILVPQQATLTLLKDVVNDNGGTALDTAWTLSANGPTPVSGVEGDVAVTDALVDAGEYTLSESSGPSGYTASSYSCVVNGENPVVGNSLTLAPEDVAVCTITNDDDAPSLTLVKEVVNDNGGTAVAGDWTLTATGYDSVSPDAGTYDLSESGPDNYTQTSLTCDNAEGQVTSVTLGLGEDVTCTFVNDDQPAKLTIIKDSDPNDTQDFNFSGTLGAFVLDNDEGVQDVEDSATPDRKTFDDLSANQVYTVTEGPQPSTYWTFVGVSCVDTNTQEVYPATVDGQSISVELVLDGDVTCTFVNHKDSPSRTLGFWKTHTEYTTSIFENQLGSSITLGDGGEHQDVIASPSALFGAWYSNVSQKSIGKGKNARRSTVDQARMQLAWQWLAAKLNCAAFGCPSDVQTLLSDASTVYAVGDVGAMLNYAGQLDIFNNASDSIVIDGDVGKATPKLSQTLADLLFWDTP